MDKNLVNDINEALRKYKQDVEYENYRKEEQLVIEIFNKYKRNTDEDEKSVLLKICVLDNLYSTNLKKFGGKHDGIYEVTKHIVKLNIDNELQNRSLDIIDKISIFKNSEGKETKIYSFATKYCFFHNPEFYIIYDRFVADSLLDLNKEYNFYNHEISKDKLKCYRTFHEIFKQFKSLEGLKNFSNRELDNFLWITGREKAQKDKKRKNQK